MKDITGKYKKKKKTLKKRKIRALTNRLIKYINLKETCERSHERL